VYGTSWASQNFGGKFVSYTGSSSTVPGTIASEVWLAYSDGSAKRAIVATGPVQLFGTASPLLLNTDTGTTGQVLTSQGANNTPIWSTVSGGTVSYSSIQTALSPTQSTPLDLGGTFRATGTTAPTSGTGTELAYFNGEGYLISGTRTTGGAISSYRPLQIQGSTIALNVTPTFPTPVTATNNTTAATTAYVISRIANDAPTKSGVGATGTWSISIDGNSSTVGNKRVVGGSGTTGAGGSVSVSTGLTTVEGFTAIGVDGYVCAVRSVSGGSVTVTTRTAGGGAVAGNQAFRWVATGP
jgi:hypothetical protein